MSVKETPCREAACPGEMSLPELRLVALLSVCEHPLCWADLDTAQLPIYLASDRGCHEQIFV